MEKPFKNFEDQVKILKGRNLQFVSEETAIKSLMRYGYYEIVNGYKTPYTTQGNPSEIYSPGTTFEQVYSLFEMDKSLRNAVMESMQEFEMTLRTATAYVVSEAFGEKEKDYLKWNNYKPGKKYPDGYKLNGILKKFDLILNDDVQPMKHYREQYGNVPPWILLKGTTFGNLVNFIKLQKTPQKNKIISMVLDIPVELVEGSQQIKDLFMDIIFLCHAYRNRSAHSGRMYNYFSKNCTVRYSPLLHKRMGISEADYRLGKGLNGLHTLLTSLSLLDNKMPYLRMLVGLQFAINRHLELYPEDMEPILKEMVLPQSVLEK